MAGCPNLVVVAARTSDGTAITRPCGDYYCGAKIFCATHQALYDRAYPQGWKGYPGDTCPHGVYVGGCAEDFMCFKCEMGED